MSLNRALIIIPILLAYFLFALQISPVNNALRFMLVEIPASLATGDLPQATEYTIRSPISPSPFAWTVINLGSMLTGTVFRQVAGARSKRISDSMIVFIVCLLAVLHLRGMLIYVDQLWGPVLTFFLISILTFFLISPARHVPTEVQTMT